LGITAWEVDKNPAFSFNSLHLFEFSVDIILLSFEGSDFLFRKTFLFKLFIDCDESVLQHDLALGRFLDLFALGLWVFVFITHSELGDKELHVELIFDLLTI